MTNISDAANNLGSATAEILAATTQARTEGLVSRLATRNPFPTADATRLALLTANSAPGFTAAMHNRAGNLALGDGSVRQVNSAGLSKQLIASAKGGSPETNRFVIP